MSREKITPQALAGRITKMGTQERAKPWPGLVDEIDIRITRDGTWLYHGSPITRKPLVKLFSTVLRREADGNYYLVTPVERCRVQVDDAPFVAVEVVRIKNDTQQVLRFRTNIDDEVCADLEHPIRVEFDRSTGEPSPYVRVRDGLDALISRPVYYELVELGAEAIRDKQSVHGVWSSGHFFELGELGQTNGAL